jgi:hypothetical protein
MVGERMSTWLSLLCPSCRPDDLKRWLDSLYRNCSNPLEIELSLTLEDSLDEEESFRWGNIVIRFVEHGEYNINQLTEICYKQSNSPYIFLSGDDTICHTKNWDLIFKEELDKYKDDVVLVYPNDTIFGQALACYPVTSRLVMDSVKWPVPYDRYCIDDTIFDIVPYSRRIYRDDVVMEHLHLSENPPGHPVIKNGKVMYYPHNVEAMKKDRELYASLQPERDEIRSRLESITGTKTKIMIAVPTSGFSRNDAFYDYYNLLEKPAGTVCVFARGQSPARNRNLMIQQALEHDCSHILFLDDDVAFPTNLLTSLIKHDKDVVTALYLMRSYPHQPIIFDYADDEGKCGWHFPSDKESGLIKIVNCGLGSVLIKAEVFKKLKKPWITLGELEKDHWCDDISFFNRVRAAGFEIYCDLDIHVGHMANVIIWPAKNDDAWQVVYDTHGTSSVSFSMPRP